MESRNTCSDPERHAEHICALHNKGMYDKVEPLTDNPTVTCAICLVNANSAQSVCSPAALGGGFNYSEVEQRKQSVVEGETADAAPPWERDEEP